MQAGMAGGSTDAASFIIAMNKLFDLAVTSAVTVFTLGATIFFAKATVENAKSVGKTFMSILKK